MFTCLNSFKMDKSCLQEVCICDFVKDIFNNKKIRNNILSEDFWDNVEKLFLTLEPLHESLTKIQTTKRFIS